MIKNIRKRFGRTARWLKSDLTVFWFLVHASGGYRVWVDRTGRMFWSAASPGITLAMEQIDFDQLVSRVSSYVESSVRRDWRQQKPYNVPEELMTLMADIKLYGIKFWRAPVRRIVADLVNDYYEKNGIKAMVG